MEPEGVISTSTVGRYTVAKSWELTPRMISAFAAGVDDPNHAYFDDSRPGGLVGHPGLVFTFQWNSRHILRDTQHPDTTRRGVHASIDARFARAFAQNDAVTSQGRTIAVRQIVPGVFITQRFTMRDSEGADIAVVDFGSIIRGARMDGPDASVEPGVAVPAPTPQPPEAEPVWVAPSRSPAPQRIRTRSVRTSGTRSTPSGQWRSPRDCRTSSCTAVPR